MLILSRWHHVAESVQISSTRGQAGKGNLWTDDVSNVDADWFPNLTLAHVHCNGGQFIFQQIPSDIGQLTLATALPSIGVWGGSIIKNSACKAADSIQAGSAKSLLGGPALLLSFELIEAGDVTSLSVSSAVSKSGRNNQPPPHPYDIFLDYRSAAA